MASRTRDRPGSRVERLLALFCAAVVVAWAIQRLVPNQADAIEAFAAPDWLPLAAAGSAAAGIMSPDGSSLRRRVRAALRWTGLLLMVWAASGLPFDLLTAAGLMGHRTAAGEIVMSTVYWPALATRAFALAAVVVLARLTLARPVAAPSTRPPAWLGYAAFALALPYPVLRVHWALGGTLGLASPGGAGAGWEPLLIAIPWALAAVLSLLLASPPRWIPRRLLLAAGWSATAIVAMIGPAAFRAFVGALAGGGEMATAEIDALGVRSVLRQLVPLGDRRWGGHPRLSAAQYAPRDALAGVGERSPSSHWLRHAVEGFGRGGRPGWGPSEGPRPSAHA